MTIQYLIVFSRRSKTQDSIKYLYFILYLLTAIAPVCTVSAQSTDSTSLTDDCTRVRAIIIIGNKITKDKAIFRELSIHTGDCIDTADILPLLSLNRLRLMNTQLFNDVNISYITLRDSLNLLIHVWERFPVMPSPNLEFADRNFNVWWSEQHRSLRRINIGLTLTDRNFLGNREQLSVIAQIGYTQKGGLSYEIPYLDRQQKHGIGFAVYGMQNREVAYITDSNKLQFYRSNTHAMLRQYQMSAWYTYRPRYAATHKIGFDYVHYWVSSVIATLNPEYLSNSRTREDVLSLSYTYKYNGVDNWEYPLNGKRLVGVLQQKLMLDNNSYQTICYLQGDKYWKFKNKWYAALIFRGKFSFGQEQPYVFRRNLGYDFDYVRGYEYYVIDGSSFALLRADIKKELLSLQFRLPIKYFQVIPVHIYAKAYADAGRACNAYPVRDYLYNKTLYSAGLGIDIVTLYDIKLRIEYTINGMGESGLYLHKNGE